MVLAFNPSLQLVVSILVASTWAYPPACHIYYGRPQTQHCNVILQSMGREGQSIRFFSIAGLERPPEISLSTYQGHVNIPKFWSNPSAPSCQIALLPVHSPNGELSWDSARYQSIAATGQLIRHHCVEASGIPRLQGSGGMEVAGDNQRLRLALYGPDSQFDREIVQRYKTGKPVAVPDVNGIPEYKTPQRQKRPRPGSESTADSTGSVVRQARVNSLGNGWHLQYDSVIELLPATDVAGPLRDFYTGVTASAADQLGAGVNATENLAFKSGPFSLELSSQEPIGWDYVINFADGMMEMLSSQFTPAYRGEVINTIWVLAAVQVSLSLQV